VRVRLVDTHDHVLSTYDRQIAIYATDQFQRQGIELVMGCRVCLTLYSVLYAVFFLHLPMGLITLSCAMHPLKQRCLHP